MSLFGGHRVSEQFPKITSTTRLHVHRGRPFDPDIIISHVSFDQIYVDSVSSCNVGAWEQERNVTEWISFSNIARKKRVGPENC